MSLVWKVVVGTLGFRVAAGLIVWLAVWALGRAGAALWEDDAR